MLGPVRAPCNQEPCPNRGSAVTEATGPDRRQRGAHRNWWKPDLLDLHSQGKSNTDPAHRHDVNSFLAEQADTPLVMESGATLVCRKPDLSYREHARLPRAKSRSRQT